VDFDGALGFVDICVNCLTATRYDSPDASSANEGADGAALCERAGMSIHVPACPRCGKSHRMPSAFRDPTSLFGYRVDPPCGGAPILLVQLPEAQAD
jgi:hypothetical protein